VTALAPYPFIVREHGSGTRAAMGQFFADHHFEPQITMEMTSNETIKQAVMAEMGVSFLSLHTIGLELRAGLLKLMAIDGTPVMRTWHIVRLQSKPFLRAEMGDLEDGLVPPASPRAGS
jgi:DNA-binding transcriptional LysR family regulator